MTDSCSEVSVSVNTAFIAQQSSEAEQRYVFSYEITIKNTSENNIKLLSRYWLITDGNGETTTVSGEGVIGEQPIIRANQSFQYSSGCVLKTPIGFMQGHYQMVDVNKRKLKVDIPTFSLAMPNMLH
jgi:ApaG protein